MRLASAISHLTQLYLEWSKVGLLQNPNYLRKGNEISWRGEQAWLPASVTLSDLASMEERRSYTMQFGDGSVLGCYYRYLSDTELAQASLSFVHSQPFVASEEVLPWFRIDYDPSSHSGILHPACHFHFYGSPTARIPVDRMPTPRAFIEAIAAWFYPDEYRAHRELEKDGWPHADVLGSECTFECHEEVARAARLIFASNS